MNDTTLRAPDPARDGEQMIFKSNLAAELTGKTIRVGMNVGNLRTIYMRVSYRSLMRLFRKYPDTYVWVIYSTDLFHGSIATITHISGMTAKTRAALHHSTIY